MYKYNLEGLQKRKWSVEEATNFYKELLDSALETIPSSGSVMVLGPMFILRNPEENFALFDKAQTELEKKGLSVFNQTSFVDYNLSDAPFEYGIKFDVFYQNLIKSGKITACYLLPGWEESQGTKTEVEFAREMGLGIYSLWDARDLNQ